MCEIRNKQFNNNKSYNFINNNRKNGNPKKGGGVCIGINTNLIYQNKSELI